MGKKGRQVFIGGLSPDAGVDDVRKVFAEIGGIVYATVWKDSETGRSKCAAKVEFESTELAQRAVEALCAQGAAASFQFATVFTDADTNQIGLQYDKVVEWLMARRKVEEDWRTALRNIQIKTNVAKKDIMADEASTDDDLDYFQIKDLCDLLQKAEDGKEKKALKEILDLYKHGNTHMAEAARSLVQVVRFDIPAAKEQAQSSQKQAQDVERRQKDLSKRDVEVKRKFREMCDTHQISGGDINTELQDYVRTAVAKCLDNSAAKITSSCQEPLQFYRSFSQALGGGEEGAKEDLMPLLHFIIANGNVLLKDAAGLNDKLKSEWQTVQEQWKNKDASTDTISVSSDPASVKVLGNTLARALVVDELVELETFLGERCWELEESEKGKLEQNSSVKVEFNLEETKDFLRKVAESVEALCGKEVQPLLLMHSSEQALRNVASQLSVQKALCEKPSKEIAVLEQRKSELSADADTRLKEVDRLRAEAERLKGWLQEEISRVVKCKVRLIGDIDSV